METVPWETAPLRTAMTLLKSYSQRENRNRGFSRGVRSPVRFLTITVLLLGFSTNGVLGSGRIDNLAN